MPFFTIRMKYVEKLRALANQTPITLESWLLSFIGIVMVRLFLEQYSSFVPRQYVLIDLPTIIHYSIFILTANLAIIAILTVSTKTSLKERFTLSLFGSFILWLPPIADLILSKGHGFFMDYLFVPSHDLIIKYFTFFGLYKGDGATPGIQIEIALILITVFIYVKYIAHKSSLRASITALLTYTVIFILAAMPSLISLFLPHQTFFGQSLPVGIDLYNSVNSSALIQNNINPQFSAPAISLFDLGFNKIMAGINLVVAMVALSVIFFSASKEKFLAIIKNNRPERTAHYLLLITIGALLGGKIFFYHWINVFSFFLTLIAFSSARFFSVCQNDLHDIPIDTISNSNRPLIQGKVTGADMAFASKIFLIIALLSAYAVSHYVLFFVFLFIFLSHIYSVPPLRLKRIPLLNSFIMGLASLSVFMAGLFLTSPDKSIMAFPLFTACGLIIAFTLSSAVKDIKDIKGDRASGVWTIPVLLGEKRAKYIIASFISLIFLIVPFYLRISFLLIPSIIFAILCWRFITAEDYKEWKFFAVYIPYLILILGSIIFLK